MLARMTILGLFEYDETIFDEMVLPEGIDKDNVVNAVLDKGSIFGVMYTNPIFMKRYIKAWSERHYSMFQRWTKAMEAQYNPIRDYYMDTERTIDKDTTKQSDRNVDNTRVKQDDETIDKSMSVDSEDTVTSSKTVEGSESKKTERDIAEEGSNHTTTTEKVSAFDSNVYQPKSETYVEGGDERKTDDDTTESGSSKEESNGTQKDVGTETSVGKDVKKDIESELEQSIDKYGEEGTEDTKVIESIVGAKAVRSIQELVSEELELARFELCEKVADMLVADICIMVY